MGYVIRDPEVVRFLMRHATIRNGRCAGVSKLLMMLAVSSGLTDCVQYLVDSNEVDLHYTFTLFSQNSQNL